MRSIKKIHNNGDKRVATWFAILPVKFRCADADGGCYWDRRWLETVSVEQTFCECNDGTGFWGGVRFVDPVAEKLREL